MGKLGHRASPRRRTRCRRTCARCSPRSATCVCTDGTEVCAHPSDASRADAGRSRPPRPRSTPVPGTGGAAGSAGRATSRRGFRADPRRGRDCDRPARHGQGRHGGAPVGGRPCGARRSASAGLRQRPDRDVARRPGEHALRARQRRVLHRWSRGSRPGAGATAADRPPGGPREATSGATRGPTAPRCGLRQRHARAGAGRLRRRAVRARWSTSPSARRARRH